MDELEARLRRLAGEIAWAATPELTVPELGVPAPAPRAQRMRRARLALAIAGLMLLMLAGGALAFPGAREAVLDWIGIGGVEVRRVPEPPRTATADYGPQVSLAAAEARIGRRLALARRLGSPDSVHLRQDALGPEATLAYENLRITEVERAGALEVVGKQVGPGTRVEPVTVGGRRGIWIAGEPHGVSVQGSGLRLAGDTLVWERDGLVLRLEGARNKGDALRVARTVR